MEFIQKIVANWDSVVLVVTSVVTIASVVSALTETKTDDKWVNRIKKVVDLLAVNVKNAKKAPKE